MSISEITTKALRVIDLGTMAYDQAYEFQKALHAQRLEELIPDSIIFVEHPHVFTLGKRGEDQDLLWDKGMRDRMGVGLAQTDRGGQTTYHGPGQLVGYLIVNLYEQSRRIKWFVGQLEEIFLRLLDRFYGIKAWIDPGRPGVWIENRKITAVGISIHNKVSMHGFAFNLDPDLGYFDGIVPCGVTEAGLGVTSLAQELRKRGKPVPTMKDLKAQVLDEFCRTYGFTQVDEQAQPYRAP